MKADTALPVEELSNTASSIESETKTTKIASKKNYVVAVCLSGVFGVLGIHHFYLGRYLEGLLDLGLAIAAFVLYINGNIGWALLIFAIDSLHTFIVTIMLLTGSVKDGEGHLVCYPGQRL